MVILPDQFVFLEPYILVFLLSSISGAWIHEGSHYFIGWFGNTDPTFQFTKLLTPESVEHGNIESIDSSMIRMLGLAPFFWIPALFVVLVLFVVDPRPVVFFALSTLCFDVFMATESDQTAFQCLRSSDGKRWGWVVSYTLIQADYSIPKKLAASRRSRV